MYPPSPEPDPHHVHDLQLLESALDTPGASCEESDELREAFENGLRQLAEDIIQYHPSLAHVLIGLGQEAPDYYQGQN